MPFETRLEGTQKGRVYVVLPFDPEKVWGPRESKENTTMKTKTNLKAGNAAWGA